MTPDLIVARTHGRESVGTGPEQIRRSVLDEGITGYVVVGIRTYLII
jgi:hypothetical protein